MLLTFQGVGKWVGFEEWIDAYGARGANVIQAKYPGTNLISASVVQYIAHQHKPRLMHWVVCLHPACVRVGKHIGSGWLPWEPSNIARQISRMAIKRSFIT